MGAAVRGGQWGTSEAAGHTFLSRKMQHFPKKAEAETPILDDSSGLLCLSLTHRLTHTHTLADPRPPFLPIFWWGNINSCGSDLGPDSFLDQCFFETQLSCSESVPVHLDLKTAKQKQKKKKKKWLTRCHRQWLVLKAGSEPNFSLLLLLVCYHSHTDTKNDSALAYSLTPRFS